MSLANSSSVTELLTPNSAEDDRFKTYKKDAREKTYLADEIIREFEETSKSIVKSPSRTHNFVKKLVATLERKSNESGECSADDEFLTKRYTRPDCQDRPVKTTPDKLLEDFSDTGPHWIQSEKESERNVSIDGFAKKSATLPANIQTPNKKISRKRSFKSFLSAMIGRKKPISERKPRRFHSCDNLEETSPRCGRIIVPDFSRASSVQIVPFEDLNKHLEQHRSATIHPIRFCQRGSQEALTTFGGVPRQKVISITKDEESDFLTLRSQDDTSDNLIKPSAVKDMARRFSLLPERSVEYSKCTLREKLNEGVANRVSRRNGMTHEDISKPTKMTSLVKGSDILPKEYSAILDSGNVRTQLFLPKKTTCHENKQTCKTKTVY